MSKYIKMSYNNSNVSNMTAQEVLALAMQTLSKGGVKADESRPGSVKKETVAYPVFDLQAQGPDISAETFTKQLVDKANDRLKSRRGLFIPGTQVTWKWTQTDARHPPDKTYWVALQKHRELSGLTTFAATHYRSNGTRKGLLSRLVSKLTVDRNIGAREHEPFLAGVRGCLPIRTGVVDETVLTVNGEVLKSINPTASVGLPYLFDQKNSTDSKSFKITGVTTYSIEMMQRDGKLRDGAMPILLHAMTLATMLSAQIGKAKGLNDAVEVWKGAVEKFPWLNTFILKRKDEVMPRSEFAEKVRPYGVQPLPARLLCMLAARAMEARMLNFLDDENSISAYKFSPYYGGANRMVNHFIKKVDATNSCCVAYGDDQLWAFKFTDGRVLLMGPDVAAMDLSTTKHHIKRVLQYIITSDTSISQWMRNLLAVWATIAFSHDLAVGGPYVLAKENSLISGIPGTTTQNIVSSGYIWSIIKSHIGDKMWSEEDFCKQLKSSMAVVSDVLNFKFKGFDVAKNDLSGMLKGVPHTIYKNVAEIREKGLTVPFLQTIFVPVLNDKTTVNFMALPHDVDKFGGSLILPSRTSNNIDSNEHRLSRTLGVFYCGGWAIRELRDVMSSVYVQAYGVLPSTVSVVPEGCLLGEDDIVEVTKEFGMAKTLPPDEFMADFNTMLKDQFRAKWTRGFQLKNTQQPRASQPSSDLSDLDVAGGAASDAGAAAAAAPVKTSAAAAAALASDLSDLDDLSQDANYNEVPVQSMGSANANTFDMKKKKLLRAAKVWKTRNIERAYKLAQRNNSKIVRPSRRGKEYNSDDDSADSYFATRYERGEDGVLEDESAQEQFHKLQMERMRAAEEEMELKRTLQQSDWDEFVRKRGTAPLWADEVDEDEEAFYNDDRMHAKLGGDEGDTFNPNSAKYKK